MALTPEPAAPPAAPARVRPALAAGVILVLAAALFAPKVSRKMPDLEVYWRAAVRARAAEPLYRIEDQHYQFKYLPAFAVLAVPGGALPLHAAKAAWYVISIALVVALLTLSPSLLPERRRPAWLLVAAALVAMAKFLAHEVLLGQVNTLLAVLVVAAVLAMRRSKEAAAGLLIALAIVVKPYAVIFLPWLLARRRWTAAAAAGVSLGGLLTMPALVYGWAGNIALHQAWWRTVTTSTAPNLANADNVSIAGMFVKWLGPGATAAALAMAVSGAVVAVAAVVVLQRRRVRFPEGLEASLLLTCIPLLSPQGWDYVFLVSMPAVVFLVNYADRLPRALRWTASTALAVIAFSLFDLMGRAAYGAFMALSIITLCYLVLLAALAALRARAVA